MITIAILISLFNNVESTFLFHLSQLLDKHLISVSGFLSRGPGTAVYFHIGKVVQWYTFTLVRWYSGIMVQWYGCTSIQWSL